MSLKVSVVEMSPFVKVVLYIGGYSRMCFNLSLNWLGYLGRRSNCSID